MIKNTFVNIEHLIVSNYKLKLIISMYYGGLNKNGLLRNIFFNFSYHEVSLFEKD